MHKLMVKRTTPFFHGTRAADSEPVSQTAEPQIEPISQTAEPQIEPISQTAEPIG